MTAPRVTPFPSDKLEKGSLKDGVHVGFDLELVHRVDRSFFSCISQLRVCIKELMATIHFYFCLIQENNGSLLNSS